MKKDGFVVGDLLQSLISRQKQESSGTGKHLLTSLGVPLVQAGDNHYSIDVSRLKVFPGLSTLVQLLTNDVIEQCIFGTADIMVRRQLPSQLLPEMAEMGTDWIMVYARIEAVEDIPLLHRQFSHSLHTVLGVLQTPHWGSLLFPGYFEGGPADQKSQVPALLFPFHMVGGADNPVYYVLLERSVPGRFLRITVENASSSRLQLKYIPHHVVDNLDCHVHLVQIHAIAEQLHQGILREISNNKAEYKEIPERQPVLFDYLRKELKDVTTIHFRWSVDGRQMLLLESKNSTSPLNESLSLFYKELQLLGDRDVLAHLKNGDLIEMTSNAHRIYFDISRGGGCLNITMDERWTVPALTDYLDRMPHLKKSCLERKGAMEGVRLFLIHHITSEVLGLIDAFREAGCEAVTTLFVKYAGVVPDDYLETLLNLSGSKIRSYSLQEIIDEDSIESLYALSQRYSATAGMERLRL